MNIKKIVLSIIFLFSFIIPLKVFAIEPIYDKEINLSEDYVVLRGTATNDGGYAVLAMTKDFMRDDSDNRYLSIIKYSSNGDVIWTKRYTPPPVPEDCSNGYYYHNNETNTDEYRCDRIQSTPIMGFTELDNGRLILVSNYFRMLFDSDGTLISTLDMGSNYYNYVGYRCEGEGEGTACVAIGADRNTIRNIFNGNNITNEQILGRVFTLSDDGSITNTYNIPSIPIVIADNAESIGVPVSFFKNEDDYYVMETIESVVPWIYVFDKNLRQISKTPVLIRNSSINIIRQVGDIYWVNGQFKNRNYFGEYIKYMGNLGDSKASYVTFDSTISDVLNEKIIAEAFIDVIAIQQSEYIDDSVIEALIKSAPVGFIGLLDGFRDGKYVSTFNVAGTFPFQSQDISQLSLSADFVRLDSSLNEFDGYNLIDIPKGSVTEENGRIIEQSLDMLLFSSVIRLSDGSDVVLLNVGRNLEVMARHIKFGNRYTVTSLPESVSNVSFIQDAYEPGDVVQMQLRQKDGYYIDKVIVRDSTGKIIPVDLKSQTFIMPESDVTIDVQYKKIEQVKTGVILSTLFSLLALGFVGFTTVKYFKQKHPIGM